ncbi:hypothetical protein DW989_05275 [Bacteroides stercoris]|nr:hypothetical protein DW989_05275 [Bacteroides stercoris]
MASRYKKFFKIAGICLICWLYALIFAFLANSCSGEGKEADLSYFDDFFVRTEYVETELN